MRVGGGGGKGKGKGKSSVFVLGGEVCRREGSRGGVQRCFCTEYC